MIYLAMGLRNVGEGIALLHGWNPMPCRAFANDPPADPAAFRRLTIDLYISPGDAGYWEAAIRDQADDLRPAFLAALTKREPFNIDLLYGDQEGGQRTISRFNVLPSRDDGWYCLAGRHWNVDRPEPRPRRAPRRRLLAGGPIPTSGPDALAARDIRPCGCLGR